MLEDYLLCKCLGYPQTPLFGGIQWGYSGCSEGTVGYSGGTVRVHWGYSEGTVRIQWGYRGDTECYSFYYRLGYLSGERKPS